jgi:splicing factor 3B subunit 1
VREAYWKIYNNIYVGDQDSLVAVYPAIDDEVDDTGDVINTYVRADLYMAL